MTKEYLNTNPIPTTTEAAQRIEDSSLIAQTRQRFQNLGPIGARFATEKKFPFRTVDQDYNGEY